MLLCNLSAASYEDCQLSTSIFSGTKNCNKQNKSNIIPWAQIQLKMLQGTSCMPNVAVPNSYSQTACLLSLYYLWSAQQREDYLGHWLPSYRHLLHSSLTRLCYHCIFDHTFSSNPHPLEFHKHLIDDLLLHLKIQEANFDIYSFSESMPHQYLLWMRSSLDLVNIEWQFKLSIDYYITQQFVMIEELTCCWETKI